MRVVGNCLNCSKEGREEAFASSVVRKKSGAWLGQF
jgi:hypothetical protein